MVVNKDKSRDFWGDMQVGFPILHPWKMAMADDWIHGRIRSGRVRLGSPHRPEGRGDFDATLGLMKDSTGDEDTDIGPEAKVAKTASNALPRDIRPIARWGMLHLVAWNACFATEGSDLLNVFAGGPRQILPERRTKNNAVVYRF